MFERLTARAEAAAARRAEAQRARIAARIPAALHPEASADGVRLSGRGLRRRLALDPALKWLLAGLIR